MTKNPFTGKEMCGGCGRDVDDHAPGCRSVKICGECNKTIAEGEEHATVSSIG